MFRLFQVEYAIEAVKLGSTAVGICTSGGVVLAIEKRLTSTLLEPSSVEKIMEVDSHIGAAVSGLIGGNDACGMNKMCYWCTPSLDNIIPFLYFYILKPRPNAPFFF